MNEQALLQDARAYLAVFHKRRATLATCLVLSFLITILYNYTTRPIYQATAQILIDRDTPNLLPGKELVDMVQSGADYYQTQYQLLRGRMLAEKVVADLDLQKSQEFQTGPLMTPWERFERRFLGKPPAAAVDTDGILLSPAVAAFRSRVTVEPVTGSRLVNLRFTAYEPKLAADVANKLAESYIKQSLEFRFTTSKEATGWLDEHIGKQQEKVEIAEKALQAYREKEGFLNFEERQSLVDQKLNTLATAALTARTERIGREALLNQMRNLGSNQLESFPLVIGNTVVQSLRTELSDLQKEYAKLSETLGDKHPDLVRVRNSIHTTEEKLRNEMRNVVRSVETEYRTAASQEASLQAGLEAAKQEALEVNRKAIEFSSLKRELETNQQLYKELLTRNKQTNLEQDLQTTNIRIVEKAEPPRSPISPQRMRNYQLALLIGLALGIGLTVFFEHLDNTLKTPEDVKEHLGPALSRHGAGRWRQERSHQLPASLAAHPEEPAVGGGRGLPCAAHEPDLLVRRDDRSCPRRDQRQPGRGQDHDGGQPRLVAGPERGEGAGGGRRPAAPDDAPALRDPQDAGALRPDRRASARPRRRSRPPASRACRSCPAATSRRIPQSCSAPPP